MDWLYCAAILLVVLFICMVVVILSSDCDLTLLWCMKFGKSPGKSYLFKMCLYLQPQSPSVCMVLQFGAIDVEFDSLFSNLNELDTNWN